MGARRKGREAALKALYSLEFLKSQGNDRREALDQVWGSMLELPDETRGFAETLVEGVTAAWDEVNRLMAETSRRWKVERMALIDRNILRLATYEIRYRTDIPVKVSINEAIEIAKKFGSQESPAFVNGILDRIAEVSGRLRGDDDALPVEPEEPDDDADESEGSG
jgi:N utilization substance protein B